MNSLVVTFKRGPNAYVKNVTMTVHIGSYNFVCVQLNL